MSYRIPVNIRGLHNVEASNSVNASFVGLSLETSSLNYFLGNSSNPNTFFINMLMQLSYKNQISLTMRVGGNTQDSTWFDPNLSTDLVVERSLKTLQESVTLGPLAFENLNNISSCIPINWIIGLNFNESLVTDPENALMMAQAAQRSLGCNLYAFEIGNEPDNFVALKQRGPGWNIQKYVNEWISYEHKLQQAVPAIADHGLEAAVFGSGWRVADLLYYKTQNTTFIRRFQSQIRGISKHDYQTSNCNPKYIPTIQDLLNHTKIDNNIKYAVSGIKQSDMINKSVRMGEFNSISCQGRDGVSNTFASALWAIDYMMLLAYNNITACNLHNRNPSFYNIADGNGTSWKAHPIFYALLFVSRAFGGSSGNSVSVNALVSNIPDIPAYGLYHRNTLKSIVFINMKQNTTHAQNISLILNATHSQNSSQLLYMSSLLADSIVSQYGVRWANQTMDDSPDGFLQGTPGTIKLTPVVSNGSITYSFTIPPHSAHLIEYSVLAMSKEASACRVNIGGATWVMILITAVASSFAMYF